MMVKRIDAYAELPPLHASSQAMVRPTLHCDLGTDWSWDGNHYGFFFSFNPYLSSSLLHACPIVSRVLKELIVKLQAIAIDVQAYGHGWVRCVNIGHEESQKSEFHKQFIEAAALGKKLHGDDFELLKPRIGTSWQYTIIEHGVLLQDNTDDEFLSHVVAEMEAKFVNNPAHKLAIGLLYLLPTKCMSLSHDIVVPSELKLK